jgi:hypothetical protein
MRSGHRGYSAATCCPTFSACSIPLPPALRVPFSGKGAQGPCIDHSDLSLSASALYYRLIFWKTVLPCRKMAAKTR